MHEQAYDSEDLLQSLLARYPDLLAGGGDLVAGSPRRWLPVMREVGVPDKETRGRDAARDVEVLLHRVERLHGTNGQVMGRVHVASPPFGWSNVETTALTIPAGLTRLIDVGIVDGPPDLEFQQPGQTDAPHQLILRLEIVPAPADGRHMLPPGRYRLDLVLTALNTDAQQYVAEVEFSGFWPDDEQDIWQRVRLIQPPAPSR